jgi:hypothetical protein
MMFEDVYRADDRLTVRDKLLESVGSWLDEGSTVRKEILQRIKNKLDRTPYTLPVNHLMEYKSTPSVVSTTDVASIDTVVLPSNTTTTTTTSIESNDNNSQVQQTIV